MNDQTGCFGRNGNPKRRFSTLERVEEAARNSNEPVRVYRCEDCGGYHLTKRTDSKELKEAKRAFYYRNTYWDEDVRSPKTQIMPTNVYLDLKPFTDYIQASIDHAKKSATEGADVRIADRQEAHFLIPQFTLVKLLLQYSIVIVKKPDNLFSLDAKEDFATESFEIWRGREKLCSHENTRDCYNGRVFIQSKQPLNSDEFDLYDEDTHKEKSVKCHISTVDFSNIESYRIEGIQPKSVKEAEDDTLIIYTTDNVTPIEEISIAGISIPVLQKENTKNGELTANEGTIQHIKDEYYAITPPLSQEKKFRLFSGRTEVEYDIVKLEDLSDQEIQELLHTEGISLQNGRIKYFGEASEEIKLGTLTFTVKDEHRSLPKTLRNRAGKFTGIVIEVLTDNKSIKDLESNTDVFFKETTEKLTDVLPYDPKQCRTFRVGKTDESRNLLEIAEEVAGDLVRVKELPNRLYAVPNDWQLKMQRKAIDKLSQMPCFEHKGLLELFERKYDEQDYITTEWEDFEPMDVAEWYILTNPDYDGCEEQREFVKKALATPDFAFLEGPPGSGKTTVLLELIAQYIARGKKVLLTASTNAAVDNILERLNKLPQEILNKILAVRIGNVGAVSETVRSYTLFDIPSEYHDEIIMRGNLVCGTIYGILKHPDFKPMNDPSQPVRPIYDCLIIDEASKTTFQDFLVPSLFSRRWVLSGDLKQLTPYVEQDTIRSALEEMPEFNRNMQRIQTLLCLAKDNRIDKKNMRFYLVIPSDQAEAAEELVADETIRFGVVRKEKSCHTRSVSVQEIKRGDKKAVLFYGAQFLFIDESVFAEVKEWIPQDYVPVYDIAHDDQYKDQFLSASTNYYFQKKKPQIELGTFDKTAYHTQSEIANYWIQALKDHPWAQEITWRLSRIHELSLDAGDSETVKRYKREISDRMPTVDEKKQKIKEYCSGLSGIALPSILQLLQKGLSKDIRLNRKDTTLNDGFEEEDFESRHTLLTFQHRMHPEISRFSAENIYSGKALIDAKEMSPMRQWSCLSFGQNHAIWLDTSKIVNRDCKNENLEECRVIGVKLRKFMQWTQNNPNPAPDSKGIWSVACLTYYKRQEHKLKQEIRKLFSEEREKSWYCDPQKHIEVFIYTVDKFQGREADVVFLSLVKSGRVTLGFMDSPNRLNVALTRARFQRVIVGSATYFRDTRKSQLLNLLAKTSNREVIR